MLLILVPWMQISKAVVSNVPVTASALMAVLAAGIALHLVFLAFNLTATTVLQLGRTATDDGAIFAFADFGCCQQHALMFLKLPLQILLFPTLLLLGLLMLHLMLCKACDYVCDLTPHRLSDTQCTMQLLVCCRRRHQEGMCSGR